MSGLRHIFSDLITFYKKGLPGRVSAIENLNGDNNLLLFNSDDKKLVFKRHWLLSAKRVDVLENLLPDLSALGLAPEVIPSDLKKTFLKVSRQYYSLMHFIEKGEEQPFSSMEEYAKQVARLHFELARVTGEELKPPLFVRREELILLFKKYGFDCYLFIYEELRGPGRNVRRQYVHNDLHPLNFLHSRFGSVYILDYDSFSTNELIKDVVFAGYRLFGSDMDRLYSFCRLYDKYNPLTDSEKESGLLWLACDLLNKLGFILWNRDKGNDFFMKDYKKYSLALQTVTTAMKKRGYSCLKS